jgi:hypothetical protein
MYSDSDIEAAIRAGVISRAAGQGFRDFVARSRATPGADEEQFRLLTGFNDIFVTIAVALVLVALGWLGSSVSFFAGGCAVAVVSWGLAEYFTRRRRMALPSIVLVASFVSSVGAAAVAGLLAWRTGVADDPQNAALLCGCAVVTAGAGYAHWRRFAVPITVALATAAGLGAVVLLLLWQIPALLGHGVAMVLAAGLLVFAFAMWWDSRDRLRVTRRSDVAFWLHLLAAPLIVHPVFNLLGLLRGGAAPANAGIAVALYVVLAVAALVVDRRALLVSALAYVLYAITSLLRGAGALSSALALAALCIGVGLLMLSALWQRSRAPLVRVLPLWLQEGVPPVMVV